MADGSVAGLAPLKGKVSEDEWHARVELAALYRLVALYGWDDMIYTHISARVPGPDHHFLINPYGQWFGEITASSLVKIDCDGNILQETPYFINPAGFTIHSAVHMNRDDAHYVMHLHTDQGVAVAAQKEGLLPLSQHSLIVLPRLAYHDYEGIALNEAEKPRLVQDLGRNTYLMLRNHGLLTVGPSIADAFLAMYMFETTCQIQLAAQAGGPLTQVHPQIVAGVAESMRVQTASQGGAFVWPALLRKLDRMDASYRT